MSNLAVAHLLQLCVVAAFGAVCGSFLNVVIYRLPRGLSVVRPRWSFCPRCREPIKWYDNLPIIGWLRLKARCRMCQSVIPPIYPIIEALCAIVFVAVWDVTVTSGGQPGFESQWPVLVSYLALYGGLLACSAMDIDTYTVDVRIPIATIAIACVCQVGRAATGIPGSGNRGAAAAALAAQSEDLMATTHTLLSPFVYIVAMAAGGAWLVTMLICLAVRMSSPSGDSEAEAILGHADELDANRAEETAPSPAGYSPGPILLLTALLAGLVIWQWKWPAAPADWDVSMPMLRLTLAAGVFLTVLILASWVERPSDEEVVNEIEAGRSEARRLATREFTTLLPALITGVAMVLWLRRGGYLAADWELVHHQHWFSSVVGRLALGLGIGAGSAVLGAGIGWTVRLLGTWGFGKEALGTGDIYILAAIASAAGCWNAFYGFFLASILALVGVVATAFRKRARAIPFGPWLALGSFVALALEPTLNRFFAPVRSLIGSLAGGSIN